VAAQSVLLPSLWLNVLLWSPTSAAWLPYVLTTYRSLTPLVTTAALLLKLQLPLGPPVLQLLVWMPLVAQPAAMVRLRLALLLVALVVAHLPPSLFVAWRAARVPLLPVPNLPVAPNAAPVLLRVPLMPALIQLVSLVALLVASMQLVARLLVPRTHAVQPAVAVVLLVASVQLVVQLIVPRTFAVQPAVAVMLLVASVQLVAQLIVPRTLVVQPAVEAVLLVASVQLVVQVIVPRKFAVQPASVVVLVTSVQPVAQLIVL